MVGVVAVTYMLRMMWQQFRAKGTDVRVRLKAQDAKLPLHRDAVNPKEFNCISYLMYGYWMLAAAPV